MDRIEKKTLFAPLEVKLAGVDNETEAKSFSGYGAYFGNIDSYGDIIAPGAFAKSLANHEAAGTMPLMLLNHDAWSVPIGLWKSMSEDDKGLAVNGELIDTTAGRDAYVALKAGAITGLSIGFRISGYEIDGKTRTITEAELLEVSVVTFPANDLARVNAVKSVGATMNDEELEDALKGAGFSEDAVTTLFASRNTPDEVDEAEDDDETKYDEAAMTLAIKSIVATVKEIHVR